MSRRVKWTSGEALGLAAEAADCRGSSGPAKAAEDAGSNSGPSHCHGRYQELPWAWTRSHSQPLLLLQPSSKGGGLCSPPKLTNRKGFSPMSLAGPPVVEILISKYAHLVGLANLFDEYFLRTKLWWELQTWSSYLSLAGSGPDLYKENSLPSPELFAAFSGLQGFLFIPK